MDFLRVGAALSDAGMAALARAAVPGTDENQIADAIERGYVPYGGLTQIHYVGLTGWLWKP